MANSFDVLPVILCNPRHRVKCKLGIQNRVSHLTFGHSKQSQDTSIFGSSSLDLNDSSDNGFVDWLDLQKNSLQNSSIRREIINQASNLSDCSSENDDSTIDDDYDVNLTPQKPSAISVRAQIEEEKANSRGNLKLQEIKVATNVSQSSSIEEKHQPIAEYQKMLTLCLSSGDVLMALEVLLKVHRLCLYFSVDIYERCFSFFAFNLKSPKAPKPDQQYPQLDTLIYDDTWMKCTLFTIAHHVLENEYLFQNLSSDCYLDVIRCYIRMHLTRDALELLKRLIQQKQSVSLNTRVVSQLVGNVCFEKQMELFEELLDVLEQREEVVTLDSRSCEQLFKMSLTLKGDSDSSQRVISYMEKSKSCVDSRALVQVFGLLRRLKKQEASWRLYCQLNERKLLCLGNDAQKEKCYMSVLQILAETKNVDGVQQVVQHALDAGLIPSFQMVSAVFRICTPQHRYLLPKLFYKFKQCGVKPLDGLYWLLIKSYLSSGWHSKLFDILDTMKAEKIELGQNKWVSILRACRDDLEVLLQIVHRMKDAGIQRNSAAYLIILSSASKADDWKCAEQFLRLMENEGVKQDVRHYSTYINCLPPEQAERVWIEMCNKGIVPDTYAYNALLNSFRRAGELDKALKLFQTMRQSSVPGNEGTYQQLCDIYQSKGDWEHLKTATQVKEWLEKQQSQEEEGLDAEEITQIQKNKTTDVPQVLESAFNKKQLLSNSGVDKPDLVTYTTLINTCGSLGRLDMALEIKNEMLAEGIIPDNILYYNLISWCKDQKNLDMALDLYNEMKRVGVDLDIKVYTNLISTCGQSNSYNHDVQAIALDLFEELQEQGIVPNAFTYAAMISVYGRCRNWEAALQVYEYMTSQDRLKPTYAVMVSLYNTLALSRKWTHGIRMYQHACRIGCSKHIWKEEVLSNGKNIHRCSLYLYDLPAMASSLVFRAWLHIIKEYLQGYPQVLQEEGEVRIYINRSQRRNTKGANFQQQFQLQERNSEKIKAMVLEGFNGKLGVKLRKGGLIQHRLQPGRVNVEWKALIKFVLDPNLRLTR